MAHIAIVGGGIGGLPTAYELRHLLPREHKITLISDRSKFTFIPSLPWVAFDMTPLENVQLEIEPLLKWRGIDWVDGRVTHLDPEAKTLVAGDRTLNYDYLVIATGASLNTDAVPGLGPDKGYTHSVCNPHHAEMAREAWLEFEANPGPLVVGAVPGASCMGPAYEFALLADHVLRKRGLRDRVPITFVSPEPYAGHLGIGGMANSGKLVTQLFEMKQIDWIENAAVTEITPDEICLADGRRLPFKYSMLLPPFLGAKFLRDVPGLTDAKGFVPVKPTYRHPDFPSIYSLGIAIQLAPPEKTPVPLGVPKTGQMTESMGMAVAHNIARDLGVIQSDPVKPTLEAICMADFGDTGIIFIAQPVLPELESGTRRRAIAKRGIWVSWIKTAFERFFMAKMQNGLGIPWFEKLGLGMLGIRLVEPLSEAERLEEMTHGSGSGSRPSGSRVGVARESVQNP
ncbi:NAD(P)/FAD-dependent oxidoreductase [Baaleninema sp.]|uniref:NAD(P)/FAD-dependent oxidoreductase n=1 Tax=Baaleninema sp. TaxID=3101197 RepID=UPI003CFC1A01